MERCVCYHRNKEWGENAKVKMMREIFVRGLSMGVK